MKRRLLAALIALMLALGCAAAYAEETEETEPIDVSITVLSAEALPMPGIEVTLRNELGETVDTLTTNEEGVVSFLQLADGLYSVKAYDPSDGYSTNELFAVPDTVELSLTLRKLVPGSKIAVGNVTKVNGYFFTEMWGNNTSDIDVRAMLYGYQTVAWTNNLKAELDTSVVQLDFTAEVANGDKTFTMTVQDGLAYSDGTPIDARDYVFSVLLQSCPEVIANGAMAYGYSHIVGFEDYNTGASEVFSGVRLLSDTQFSITVSGDYLPYFYELVYLNIQPYPISVIAPGCEVADEGEGVMIRSILDEDGNPRGEFTADMLEITILDPDEGYLNYPSVVSGPYQLVSYDKDSGIVEFVANPYYKGNYEGQRPLIEFVTLKPIDKTNMLDMLDARDIDIINKLTDVEVIESATALRDEVGITLTTYLRSGQSFIGLACEQGPTAYENVRKAMYHCLDQQLFTTEYTGTYGLPVYSNYGLGQWMATGYINTMQDEVTTYDFDVEEAKKLLDADGWTYNEKGEKFVEGTDTVRCRKLSKKEADEYNAFENPIVKAITVGDDMYMPLELVYANIPESGLCALVNRMFIPNLESVGFRVIPKDIGFTDMLRCYYRQDSRTFNTFALASNFTFVYDPYFEFSDSPNHQGTLNRSGISDKKLSDLAKKLRETPPDNDEMFIERWLELMVRYSDVLPTLPIYSNMYIDIAAPDVQGYEPNNTWSWPVAILYVYYGEPEPLTPDANVGEEGTLIFE